MKMKIGNVDFVLDADSISFEGATVTSPFQARLIASSFMNFAKAKEQIAHAELAHEIADRMKGLRD